MPPIFFELQIDNYISIIAGIGAFASAVAALFTIQQVKKQREASYQPDIYFGFNGSKTAIIKKLAGIVTKELSFEMLEGHNTFEIHSILHSIENIGLGTAKDIKIVWDFDFKKAFNTILETQANGNPKIRVEMERGNTLVIRTQNKTMFYVWSEKENLITEYDFVLPRRDEKFVMSPSIPIEIVKYFTAYCMLKYNLLLSDEKYADLFHEEFETFPPLKVHVVYKDIGNKTYAKNFRVHLTFSTPFEKTMIPLTEANTFDIDIYAECKELQ